MMSNQRQLRAKINLTIADLLASATMAALSPSGFRARRGRAERRLGGIVHLVAPARLPWALPNEGRFTLECGVYIDGLWAIYSGEPPPRRPTLPRSPIAASIGWLASPRINAIWSFTADSPADALRSIVDEMTLRLRRDALPWFDRLATYRQVADALATGRTRGGFEHVQARNQVDSLRYAAAAYFLGGDRERARSCAERAFALDPHDDWVGGIAAFRDRIMRLIDEVEAQLDDAKRASAARST
jgi:hypothetical protein